MSYEPLKEPKLRWWMGKGELKKLARAAHVFFSKLGDWCIWPARQLNPLTASLPILGLIAWQRNIKRYAGEPERLYRLRTAHAYANGKDAGSVNGWKRIFARLELGDIELEERMPGQDWDIIGIVVDDSSFPDQADVTEIIIDEYGRTCRRYRLISRIYFDERQAVSCFDCDFTTFDSEETPAFIITTASQMGLFDADYFTLEN